MKCKPSRATRMTKDRFSRSASSRRLLTWGLAMLGGIAGISGCFSAKNSDLPETAIVRGTVLFNGEPLPEGVVKFYPELSGRNPAIGMIEEDGSFQVSTYQRHDGATVGKHKVTVIVNPRLDGSSPDPPYQIPRPYQSPKTTPLEVEITNEGANQIDLEIK